MNDHEKSASAEEKTGNHDLMNPENLVFVRKVAGRIGALLFLLLAIVLVDSLVSRFTAKFNVHHTKVDGQFDLTGPMPANSKNVTDLYVETDSPEVTLTFTEVFSGFWYGSPMWRAKVRITAKTLPGEYYIKVRDKSDTKVNPALVFLAKVYSDELSLRKSHGPFLKRHFSITEEWAAPILITGLVLIMLFNYGVSSLLEKALADIGRAEVYMVKRVSDGIQIAFALGKKHDLKIGEQLDILNAQGNQVGEATVLSLGKTDSLASVVASIDARDITSVRRRPDLN